MEAIYGNTGMFSLEISRTSKGDYSYTLKTYASMKGRAPEAAIERANKMRLVVEERLGLRPEIEPEQEADALMGGEKPAKRKNSTHS